MFDAFIERILSFTEEGGAAGWAILAVTALLATVIIKAILRVASSRLRKLAARSQSKWDDIGLDIIDGLKTLVLFSWILFLFSQPFLEKTGVRNLFQTAVVVLSVWQLAVWGLYLIKNWRLNILDRRIRSEPSSAAALELLYTAVQAVFIVTLVLIGLSNLGVNISALIAGLGVGGIAVALAAQNILGDLLASLSIVFDKPFVVGDFIVTGDKLGTVEHIGIKTTRLRSLAGEQLVISNKSLLESQIQNFKRMWVRRVVQSFGVVYSTPADTLERIPVWVKEIVERDQKLKFDRCHFRSYGASSLDFELVFFVNDPDYNIFMDHQQTVLLGIFRKFQSEKVDFAFPTQTLHIESLPRPASEVT